MKEITISILVLCAYHIIACGVGSFISYEPYTLSLSDSGPARRTIWLIPFLVIANALRMYCMDEWTGKRKITDAIMSEKSSLHTVKWSRENKDSLIFLLKGHFDGFDGYGVHPSIYSQMLDLDEIDFCPDSLGRMTIPTFLSNRVIVSDLYTPNKATS